MVSNCYLFALRRRWQVGGGYVVTFRSSYGPWCHAVYSVDLVEYEEFVPRNPKRRWPWWQWWRVLLFAGQIRTGRLADLGARRLGAASTEVSDESSAVPSVPCG